MALKVVNTESLDRVADAINAKSGTSGAIQFPEGFVDAIGAIQAGGGGSLTSPKEVNFYDYDGTLLHAYTVEEAQALTELPELPTQKGLICQGWNYDLETIKAYNRAVNVGATYITDDGKTRLYIRIATEGRMTVPLYFKQTVANGVTIDWGDGSATETIGGTGDVNTSHTYANIGDYVISLNVADGCTMAGGVRYKHSILGSLPIYNTMLQRVELGNNALLSFSMFSQCYTLTSITIPNGVTSLQSAFSECYALTSVVIPNSVTSIGSSAFSKCYTLTSLAIPNSVTSIGERAFSECYALTSVVIPNSVTSLNGYAFNYCHTLTSLVIPNGVKTFASSLLYACYSLVSVNIPNGVTKIDGMALGYCYSLASLVIPNSVTSIGNNTFTYCDGIAFYDFTKHTKVPTLSSSSAFSNNSSDFQIRVPASLYDEWIAATNWSAQASKIVAVEV